MCACAAARSQQQPSEFVTENGRRNVAGIMQYTQYVRRTTYLLGKITVCYKNTLAVWRAEAGLFTSEKGRSKLRQGKSGAVQRQKGG